VYELYEMETQGTQGSLKEKRNSL